MAPQQIHPPHPSNEYLSLSTAAATAGTTLNLCETTDTESDYFSDPGRISQDSLQQDEPDTDPEENINGRRHERDEYDGTMPNAEEGREGDPERMP
jgi:hypothetical protein